jgi:hypothetical protein
MGSNCTEHYRADCTVTVPVGTFGVVTVIGTAALARIKGLDLRALADARRSFAFR